MTAVSHLLQKLDRQKAEELAHPQSEWGEDRLESDTEDFDSEDYMPIPLAGSGPSSSKASTRAPILIQIEDEEDECQILEVYDVMPLAFTLPAGNPEQEASDSGIGGAHAGTKKRPAATAKKSDAPAGTRQKKRKVSGMKPKPTGVG